MDITRGFQIEQPDLFIPWKVSETELQQLFLKQPLRHVTHGYFTTNCTSLGGLSHELGFHFHPRRGGVLIELEFFRTSYADQAASYQEFQRHLEQTFGQPTTTTAGSEGFSSHTWQLTGAEIAHFVYDRFGLEEHVRIKKR
ncbi:MAG: hypothetical protein EBZ44_04735 [Verrucomicrobia bacterium]|nr:hypothetical protein [bacterium]NDA10308.1 hypothetical protein [Verrucomicrobiota bacterium]NDA26269.1 hypothetical protein [Verrucomicrobiota bacterium]NDD57010.1 hypothetical protein [Verrucomicrobiota bacterium]NDD81889.1 hypothetical protein [Verrucomicrobiota bacterium]